MQHAPGVSWANSFRRSHITHICDRRKNLLEFHGPILEHFFITSKSLEPVSGASWATSWANSSRFLSKSFSKVNGKCSWSFLGRFLHASLLDPHEEFIENELGNPWNSFLTFLYQILMKGQWKVLLEFAGQFPVSFRHGFFLKCCVKSLGNAHGTP